MWCWVSSPPVPQSSEIHHFNHLLPNKIRKRSLLFALPGARVATQAQRCLHGLFVAPAYTGTLSSGQQTSHCSFLNRWLKQIVANPRFDLERELSFLFLIKMKFMSKISSVAFIIFVKLTVLGWFHRRTKMLIPPRNLWMISSQMMTTTPVKEVSGEWWVGGGRWAGGGLSSGG